MEQRRDELNGNAWKKQRQGSVENLAEWHCCAMERRGDDLTRIETQRLGTVLNGIAKAWNRTAWIGYDMQRNSADKCSTATAK